MPIYEYRCEECGKTFEKIVFGLAASEIECPVCHSKRVNKLFSSFSTKGIAEGAESFSGCSTGSGGFS